MPVYSLIIWRFQLKRHFFFQYVIAPKGMTNIAKDFSVSNFYGHYWGLSSAFHAGISFLCRYRPSYSSSANEDLHTFPILLHFLHYLHDSNRNVSRCRPWLFNSTERAQVGKSPFLRHRPALSRAIYRTWGVAAFARPIGVTADQHPNSSRCSSTVIPSAE